MVVVDSCHCGIKGQIRVMCPWRNLYEVIHILELIYTTAVPGFHQTMACNVCVCHSSWCLNMGLFDLQVVISCVVNHGYQVWLKICDLFFVQPFFIIFWVNMMIIPSALTRFMYQQIIKNSLLPQTFSCSIFYWYSSLSEGHSHCSSFCTFCRDLCIVHEW